MDEGLHRLIRRLTRLFERSAPHADEFGLPGSDSVFGSVGQDLRPDDKLGSAIEYRRPLGNAVVECPLDLAPVFIVHDAREAAVLQECRPEGLGYTGRHGVVESRDGLAAMLVRLIGLDHDACQRGIRSDAVGGSDVSMSGMEASLKELSEVDLRACCRQREEVQVMDVNASFPVGLGKFRADDLLQVVFLGDLAPVP